MANSFDDLQEECDNFVEDRDWDEFHTPKNVAMSISIEANELLEIFQWHDDLTSDRVKQESKVVDEVEDELADIVIYCMTMANELDIDLGQAVSKKIDVNKSRFNPQYSERLRKKRQQWQK